MEKRINVVEAMKGTPRPHYMIGEATYEREGNLHRLFGKVNFTSTEEHISIRDRAQKYLLHPHVNAGDVCFAIWNAAHIVADLQGYKERTLVDEVKVIPVGLIPPDKELDLELLIEERERKLDKSKRGYELGSLFGKVLLNGELLTEVRANYFARK